MIYLLLDSKKITKKYNNLDGNIKRKISNCYSWNYYSLKCINCKFKDYCTMKNTKDK